MLHRRRDVRGWPSSIHSKGCRGRQVQRAIALDRNTGEIYAPDARAGVIRVLPASLSGRVAPSRTIGGPTTGLREPSGIAVFGGKLFVADASTGHILVFSQLASGDAAPLRVIGTPDRLERIEVGGSAVIVARGQFTLP